MLRKIWMVIDNVKIVKLGPNQYALRCGWWKFRYLDTADHHNWRTRDSSFFKNACVKDFSTIYKLYTNIIRGSGEVYGTPVDITTEAVAARLRGENIE